MRCHCSLSSLPRLSQRELKFRPFTRTTRAGNPSTLLRRRARWNADSSLVFPINPRDTVHLISWNRGSLVAYDAWNNAVLGDSIGPVLLSSRTSGRQPSLSLSCTTPSIRPLPVFSSGSPAMAHIDTTPLGQLTKRENAESSETEWVCSCRAYYEKLVVSSRSSYSRDRQSRLTGVYSTTWTTQPAIKHVFLKHYGMLHPPALLVTHWCRYCKYKGAVDVSEAVSVLDPQQAESK